MACCIYIVADFGGRSTEISGRGVAALPLLHASMSKRLDWPLLPPPSQVSRHGDLAATIRDACFGDFWDAYECL